jgi:hypothetical protein
MYHIKNASSLSSFYKRFFRLCSRTSTDSDICMVTVQANICYYDMVSFSEICDFKWEVIDIWGYHDDDDVHIGLLGCNTVWTCRQIPTFRRNIPSPHSGLVTAWKSTLRYDQEDQLRREGNTFA